MGNTEAEGSTKGRRGALRQRERKEGRGGALKAKGEHYAAKPITRLAQGLEAQDSADNVGFG